MGPKDLKTLRQIAAVIHIELESRNEIPYTCRYTIVLDPNGEGVATFHFEGEYGLQIDQVALRTANDITYHIAGNGWRFDFGNYSHVYPGTLTIREIQELVTYVYGE